MIQILQEEKKEAPSTSVAKVEDDDGIDTNVTFDQDVDYSASESGRRLPRPSSPEMPSVYNTANVSPARSFSSGGRSPDTVYLSGSEDLPSYKASPARSAAMTLPPKYLKAGLSSPEPVGATQRQVYNPSNDDNQFLARAGPAVSSSSSAGPSSGGLRKRHSIAATSSATPFEARSLTTSSSFPAPGVSTEEKPPPRSVGQSTDVATPHGVSESRELVVPPIAALPVAIEDDTKSSSPPRAEASSKETLGDNWEMVSPDHQSKGLGPEWVSVPKPTVADTPLEVPAVQGEFRLVVSATEYYSLQFPFSSEISQTAFKRALRRPLLVSDQ